MLNCNYFCLCSSTYRHSKGEVATAMVNESLPLSGPSLEVLFRAVNHLHSPPLGFGVGSTFILWVNVCSQLMEQRHQ